VPPKACWTGFGGARLRPLAAPSGGRCRTKRGRRGGSASRTAFRPRRRLRPRNSAPAAVPCLRSRNRHVCGVPSALVEQPPAASESACRADFGGARLRPLAAPSGGGAAQSAAEGGFSVPRGLPPPAALASAEQRARGGASLDGGAGNDGVGPMPGDRPRTVVRKPPAVGSHAAKGLAPRPGMVRCARKRMPGEFRRRASSSPCRPLGGRCRAKRGGRGAQRPGGLPPAAVLASAEQRARGVPCLRSRNRHVRGVPSALVEQPPAASKSACRADFGGARLRPLAAPSGGGAAQSAAEGGLSAPAAFRPRCRLRPRNRRARGAVCACGTAACCVRKRMSGGFRRRAPSSPRRPLGGEVPRKARRKGGSASRRLSARGGARVCGTARPRCAARDGGTAARCARKRMRADFGGARLRPLAAPSGGGAAQSAAEGGFSVPRSLPPAAVLASAEQRARGGAIRDGGARG